MAWKSALYGTTEQPAILLANVFGVITLFGAYGWWWTDFVPSPEWADIGFNITIAATVILSAIYYRAYLAGRVKLRIKTSRPVKVFVLTGMPFLLCLLLSLAVTHGVGSIATQLIGHEIELTTELTKKLKRSRYSCDYRLTGYALERAEPGHLCITENEFKVFPRTGLYDLKATQTKLGLHIKSVSLSKTD